MIEWPSRKQGPLVNGLTYEEHRQCRDACRDAVTEEYAACQLHPNGYYLHEMLYHADAMSLLEEMDA